MTDFLAQLAAWINVPLNWAARFLLAPVALLPGWLSNTIISAVLGVVLLVIFKYTSNQGAIGKVRDGIKANMLALKLFKDDLSVTLKAQGKIFKGAILLIFHAARPMLVMILPVSFVLGQMGLWYQVRPLMPGEETIITMQLNDRIETDLTDISIASMPTARITTGPVRVASEHRIYWKIEAVESGVEPIIFQIGDEQIEKSLAVGDGFMRASAKRPGRNVSDIIMNPAERPFATDSVVQSISIDYPDRPGRTCGTDWWLGYFFIASMAFALIFKPFLNVRI